MRNINTFKNIFLDIFIISVKIKIIHIDGTVWCVAGATHSVHRGAGGATASVAEAASPAAETETPPNGHISCEVLRRVQDRIAGLMATNGSGS